MKNTLLLFLFLLFSQTLFSQDLIVTINNDSINCKITEVSQENIFFEFDFKGTRKESLLAMSKVSDMKYGYFIIKGTKDPSIQPQVFTSNKKINRFRFSIGGGIGYRLSSTDPQIPSQLQGHIDQLKLGYTIVAKGGFFFNKYIGIGLKYAYNNAHNKETINNVGDIEDEIVMNFIAPLFMTRFINKRSGNTILLNAGFGYLDYENEGTFTDNSINHSDYFKISGGTLGIELGVGYDMIISDTFSLGIQADLIVGTLTTIEYEENGAKQVIVLPEEEGEGISRIDLTLALVLNK